MTSEFLWWRDGVIYQIYPRSFADSNGDGIGDLRGIIGKLDYLADLGIDAIWLSPINPSPDVDFGYDVSDYKDIDPKFGSMADFGELIEQAHRRGIHIIMDLVLNHTSDQHPWFIESRSSLDNPKRDWYLWRKGTNKGNPPNNWQSWFGGKGWGFDPVTGEYYFHMFYKEQPDLNWRNPAVREEMLNTLHFWLRMGVDGFRLDVFNEYFKDSKFRNNPRKLGIRAFERQVHIYDMRQPDMMGVVNDIRKVLDGYPEKYVVGESFFSTVEEAAEFCGPGKLNATFEFSFLQNPWNPSRFLSSILKWEKSLSTDSWPTYVLNNHDNIRSASRFQAREDDEKMKVASAMLLTLRGTPFLYYGEEIAMRDIPVSRSEIQDPVGKRYWPVPVGRDGCRSPMQWTSDPGAGFSTGKPWLKLNQDYVERNVAGQEAEADSLLNFYKSLLKIRKQYPALQKGMFIPLHHNPKRVLAYIRQDADQTILVALNFARSSSKLAMGGELMRSGWELLLSNKEHSGPILEKGWLKLQGYEACILIQK